MASPIGFVLMHNVLLHVKGKHEEGGHDDTGYFAGHAKVVAKATVEMMQRRDGGAGQEKALGGAVEALGEGAAHVCHCFWEGVPGVALEVGFSWISYAAV